jgi:hypothetical protein
MHKSLCSRVLVHIKMTSDFKRDKNKRVLNFIRYVFRLLRPSTLVSTGSINFTDAFWMYNQRLKKFNKRPFLNMHPKPSLETPQAETSTQNVVIPIVDRLQDTAGETVVSSAKEVASLGAEGNGVADALDVNFSLPMKTPFEQSKELTGLPRKLAKPHRDAHRHQHGFTNQVARRRLQKEDDVTDEPSLKAL